MAGGRHVTLSPGAAAQVMSAGRKLAETFHCRPRIMNLVLVSLQGKWVSIASNTACPQTPAACLPASI